MQVDSEEESNRSSIIVFDRELRKVLPPAIDSYNIGCKFGLAGSFSSSTLWIAKCKEEDDGTLYMARKTEIDKLSQTEMTNIQDEMKLSSFLNHPCILFSYTSFVVERFIWSIFPLYDFGSCHDLIVAEFHNGLPILLVSMVLRSVILALCYLHKMGFIHRAVKGSHILISSEGSVCLSGLRYCYKLDDVNEKAHCFPSNAVPLFPWLAPEILQQDLCGYNDRADIYSLGITAVELVTGAIPFSKLRPTELLLQKVKGVVPQLPDEALIEDFQCDISLSSSQLSLDGIEQTNDMMCEPHSIVHSTHKRIRSMQQFVDACLRGDPNARPSATQLKDSPYMKLVKRKLKERDCCTFLEMLRPISPIREFRTESLDGVKHVVDGIVESGDETWIF